MYKLENNKKKYNKQKTKVKNYFMTFNIELSNSQWYQSSKLENNILDKLY